MRKVMKLGISALALGAAGAVPATAQESATRQTSSPGASECTCPPAQTSASREDQQQRAQASNEKDGSVRDALGDPPVNPGAGGDVTAEQSGNRTFEQLAERMPPPDVSDRDIESADGTDSQAQASANTGSQEQGSDSQDEDLFEEGEVVPEGITEYQGPDMWEGEGAADVDSDTGPSTIEENRQAQQGDQSQTSEETASTPQGSQDLSASQTEDDAVPQARARREQMDRDARGERRQRLVRIALNSARQAFPEARFRTYDFQVEDGRRVIEIAGRDERTGRPVTVDVFPNGRIQSISEAVPLDSVPVSVRSAVRQELGGMMVSRAERSRGRNLDLSYRFVGQTRSGRPVTVEIGADGNDLNVRYHNQS